eukprot:5256481-Ditylum_brightwellii.AAC.1
MAFTAAALHYNLHLSAVIQYAGNNYTVTYQDIDKILNSIKDIIPPENYTEVKQVFQIRSLAVLKAESSCDNFLKYWRYDNHNTLKKNLEK